MRLFALASSAVAAALALSSAAPALATPAAVEVSISPALQDKAERIYGERDVRELADLLKSKVERRLADSRAYDDARIELVLADAIPNRPTMKQMTDVPNLSFDSFSIGGASIEGRIVTADGRVTPLRYSHYEPDLRWAWGHSTWGDAETTIDRFAYDLGRGRLAPKR